MNEWLNEEDGPQVDTALLYSTTDASVWASEFAKVKPEVDAGLMISWFANAIETGRAAGLQPNRGQS